MSDQQSDPDWKLNLRYGKTQTPFKHFTLIAEGFVETSAKGATCRPGKAFMGMKTWASSHEESAHMIQQIAPELGFRITGDIQIYDTEPEQPPRENPFGYSIKFTPFEG